MNRYLKNWRTTTLGAGAIMTALADFLTQLASNDWDFTRLQADLLGLITGVGLVFARDAVVSEKEHHEERQKIAKVAAEVK